MNRLGFQFHDLFEEKQIERSRIRPTAPPLIGLKKAETGARPVSASEVFPHGRELAAVQYRVTSLSTLSRGARAKSCFNPSLELQTVVPSNVPSPVSKYHFIIRSLFGLVQNPPFFRRLSPVLLTEDLRSQHPSSAVVCPPFRIVDCASRHNPRFDIDSPNEYRAWNILLYSLIHSIRYIVQSTPTWSRLDTSAWAVRPAAPSQLRPWGCFDSYKRKSPPASLSLAPGESHIQTPTLRHSANFVLVYL